MRALVPLLCIAALPLTAAESDPPMTAAASDRPMTAAEFDAATVGRTLYYNSGGRAYGAEQYLPGRKVIWAFLGDDCRRGRWYEKDGFICFVYEDTPDPQCWSFFVSNGRLTARYRDDPFGMPLVAVEKSVEPMECLGPDVGV